jgi:hypothetical protein
MMRCWKNFGAYAGNMGWRSIWGSSGFKPACRQAGFKRLLPLLESLSLLRREMACPLTSGFGVQACLRVYPPVEGRLAPPLKRDRFFEALIFAPLLSRKSGNKKTIIQHHSLALRERVCCSELRCAAPDFVMLFYPGLRSLCSLTLGYSHFTPNGVITCLRGF